MLLEDLTASGAETVASSATTLDNNHRRDTADVSFWTAAAPRVVCRRYAARDAQHAWKTWQHYLRKRRRPAALERLTKGNASPLAWGAGGLALSDRCLRLLRWLRVSDIAQGYSRRRAKNLAVAGHAWLDEITRHDAGVVNPLPQLYDHQSNGRSHGNGRPHAQPLDADAALEALAWGQLLVRRAELFDGELWWPIFEQLCRLAQRDRNEIEQDPLAHLLAVELLLTLAQGLPEIEQSSALQGPAHSAFVRATSELLDEQGLPRVGKHSMFSALLASLIRSRFFAAYLADQHCEADAKLQLAASVAIRLLRSDGSLLLSPRAADANEPPPFKWLAAIAAVSSLDKPTRRLIRTGISGRHWKAARMDCATGEIPSPAMHSEPAKVAIMRPDWSRRGARLAIDYSVPAVRIELEFGGEPFFIGNWEFGLEAEGRTIAPAGPWRDVCWVSDKDCDYLELEMRLADSMRIQRQLLLARHDQFLFLADAILGEQAHDLDYVGRLPMANRIEASAAPETWESLLAAGKRRAVVLPLALNEWRSHSGGGSLQVSQGVLECRQAVHARRLYAPLWIDLSGRGADEPLTWRQLAVAEQRQNQPRDMAAGYRVQFGRHQWLIYRSLTPPANRTVLGMNLSTDFFLGRFQRDGETKTILEVE